MICTSPDPPFQTSGREAAKTPAHNPVIPSHTACINVVIVAAFAALGIACILCQYKQASRFNCGHLCCASVRTRLALLTALLDKSM